jgi:hypothetical protein
VTALLVCFFCGEEIDPNGSYYPHVRGWERPGRGISSRSGSSLVLRERVRDEVACVDCITKLLNGVNPTQPELL